MQVLMKSRCSILILMKPSTASRQTVSDQTGTTSFIRSIQC